jgi:peroxisomal 2,4-dienoyl-CoA reductase
VRAFIHPFIQYSRHYVSLEIGCNVLCSAGAAGNFLASINQLSVNAFKSVMDIDVLGSYNTAKATLPYLQESAAKHRVDPKTLQPSPLGTGGRIIFVSATFHYTGMVFQTHVSVAKAGVDALSNNISLEFGPLGVTSNVVTPGPIANT